MRKLFLLLVSLLLILGAFTLEGGALSVLFVGTALVPVLLGTLLGTMFTFSLGEIADTFRDAFSEQVDPLKLESYRMDRLVIKNMASAIVFWSLSIVILGLIMVLCNVTKIAQVGPGMAVFFTALFLAFGLKALLFIPMETSIRKKLVILEKA